LKNASNEEIKSSYLRLKSCRKVADLCGMSAQSVHNRVVKMGINNSINVLTDEEKSRIKEFYASGFKTGDGKLKAFCESIGRTIPFVSRYAKTIGLSDLKRKIDDKLKHEMGISKKKWYQENEHPKGMKGKTHSKEMKASMSSRVKAYFKNLSPEQKALQYQKSIQTQRDKGGYNRPRGTWNSAWRIIGGKTKFFRSRWEANYARYLESLKLKGKILDWEHEPKTFWFLDILRGSRSYLPDFKVINLDGTHYWVEVKGWMDTRSKTKLKRFAKYYPDEKMEVVQGKWFKENSTRLMEQITDWELDFRRKKA